MESELPIGSGRMVAVIECALDRRSEIRFIRKVFDRMYKGIRR